LGSEYHPKPTLVKDERPSCGQSFFLKLLFPQSAKPKVITAKKSIIDLSIFFFFPRDLISRCCASAPLLLHCYRQSTKIVVSWPRALFALVGFGLTLEPGGPFVRLEVEHPIMSQELRG
jgi:hypothetical protein